MTILATAVEEYVPGSGKVIMYAVMNSFAGPSMTEHGTVDSHPFFRPPVPVIATTEMSSIISVKVVSTP